MRSVLSTRGVFETPFSRREVLAAGALGLAAAPWLAMPARAQAASQRLVTVELFTSQGCSSCPPADALLRRLAMRDDVLALSWPVDYWDYLGWHDTMAQHAFTERQRGYARKIDPHQPYTPQMILDGVVDVVGNNPIQVDAALDARLKLRSTRVAITPTMMSEKLMFEVGAGPALDATLWLVRYRALVEVEVEAGENQGRDLTYANVVESCSPLGMWKSAPASFELTRADLGPMDGNYKIAAILQCADCGPVLGAARL